MTVLPTLPLTAERVRLGTTLNVAETLVAMLNEGAPLSDEQFPVIHAYLSRHFGIE